MTAFLGSLKAIASLIGVSLTAASAVAELPVWITVVAAVATAVATWAIPNISKTVMPSGS